MELRKRNRVPKVDSCRKNVLRTSCSELLSTSTLLKRKAGPTVIRLNSSTNTNVNTSSMDVSSCVDGVPRCSRIFRKSVNSVVCKINDQDCDLTLLENLEWMINFPIGSLFPFALDPGDSSELRKPARCRSTNHQYPKTRIIEKSGSQQTRHNSYGNHRRSFSTVASNDRHPIKKPRLSYPQLIEKCLRENGGLTVHGIYQWLSEKYPFFRSGDGKWKNAIRHNLSIRAQFRKGEPRGRSHVWYLDDKYYGITEYYHAMSNRNNQENQDIRAEGSPAKIQWLPRNEVNAWNKIDLVAVDVNHSPDALSSYRAADHFNGDPFNGSVACVQAPYAPYSEIVVKTRTPLNMITGVELEGTTSERNGSKTVEKLPAFFDMTNAISDGKYEQVTFEYSDAYTEVPRFIDQMGAVIGNNQQHTRHVIPIMECDELPSFDIAVGNEELFLRELESFGVDGSVMM